MQGWIISTVILCDNYSVNTKVRDTIEEVNVNGFLMNNITFMPTIPQCIEIYQLCWL